jgi:hypothetical protein
MTMVGVARPVNSQNAAIFDDFSLPARIRSAILKGLQQRAHHPAYKPSVGDM